MPNAFSAVWTDLIIELMSVIQCIYQMKPKSKYRGSIFDTLRPASHPFLENFITSSSLSPDIVSSYPSALSDSNPKPYFSMQDFILRGWELTLNHRRTFFRVVNFKLLSFLFRTMELK